MPDATAVFAALVALIGKLDANPGAPLALTTALADIDGLDSIRLIETIALLEEHFAVEVATHDLDQLHCLADIVRAITHATSAA